MTAALIIAAGATPSREAFQPLKDLDGVSAVERQIHVFQMAGAERVVVVAGADYQAVERKIARMGVVMLASGEKQNPEMLHSVKLGLSYLVGKCGKALVTPVDVPLFSAATVERLVACPHPLAVPRYGGKAGHPLALSAVLFPGVLAYDGADGLSGAVKNSGQNIHYIDVPDEGVLWDVQKQDNPGPLLQRHSLRALRPEVKLYLAREHVFFGPGPYLLLSLIAETGSLRLACRQMGISYSKGWNMVANMEKQAGFAVVASQRGGKEKGRSEITRQGQDLLRAYANFMRESRGQIQRLFEKHFAGLNASDAAISAAPVGGLGEQGAKTALDKDED